MRFVLETEAKKADLKDESAINDYVTNNTYMVLGALKPRHIHIVIQSPSGLAFEQVGKWLGIPAHLIKPNQGRGALLDMVEYFTHEHENQQKLGKHLYSDDEVHTSGDFRNWREQLNNRKADEAIYGAGRTTTQKYILDVQNGRKTLNQCYREMDGIEYNKNLLALQRARGEYLAKGAIIPNTRINFYFEGGGGIGKDTACLLLARSLCPDIEFIEDIVFEVGGENVAFQRYDGQPVVIYSDVSAASLIKKFGRDMIKYNLLESHPKQYAGAINIKNSSTRLVNLFSIINGIEPYDKFLMGLAGEYTDKYGNHFEAETRQMGQFYRRVPIILPLREENFSILVNKGVFEGTREYEYYLEYTSTVANFGRASRFYGGNTPRLIEITKNAIAPIVEVEKVIREKCDSPEYTEAEEQELLQDFGKIKGGLLLIQRLSELSAVIGKCYSTEREKVLAEHNIHHSDYATKLNLDEVDNFYSDFYYKISSTTDDIEVAELTLELEAGILAEKYIEVA
jgi:hypothetical protein